jgi:hypothetical protein
MRRTLIICALAMLAPITWAVAGGQASGATPAPTATTGSATNVGGSTATVNGTVNPQGQATAYHFEYGMTNAYGAQTASVNAGSGTAAVAASAHLAGLAASTTYHFRLVAVNGGGTTMGGDQTLKTTAPPAATNVQTGDATNLTTHSVTVHGSVVPNGAPTTCSFSYGPTTNYGSNTNEQTIAPSSSPVAVSASIAGLQATGSYHYRLACEGAAGEAPGGDQTFKTDDRGPSRVAIAGRRLFISPTGLVGVFVACFGDRPCKGRMSLKSGNAPVAGSVGYTIANNTETVVFTNLTRTALQTLRTGRPMSAQATTVDNDGPRSTIPFRLFRELLH